MAIDAKTVKLLRKVQKHILEEPKRFVMGADILRGNPGELVGRYSCSYSYNANNPYEQTQAFPSCGTVACINGWANILDEAHWSFPESLIFASHWPEEFRARYAKAKTPATRALIAAERIEAYIRQKGRE